MALLTLIIALLIERHYHKTHRREGIASNAENGQVADKLYSNPRTKLSSDNWFINYQLQVNKLLSEQSWFSGWVKEFALVILPAILVYIAFESFDHGFIGSLIMLAFAVLVLVHCLGPETPRSSLRQYFDDVRNQDEQGAYQRAKAFSGQEADDWEGTQANVSRAIFRETQIRYFAVVIWFAFFGPAGALLYRLMNWYSRQHELGVLGRNLKAILEWIPARISAIAYLLAGDMANGISVIKRKLFDFEVEGLALVEQTGVASMGAFMEEVREEAQEQSQEETETGVVAPAADLGLSVDGNRCALKLSERTGVILFAFVAIVSLLGWSFV